MHTIKILIKILSLCLVISCSTQSTPTNTNPQTITDTAVRVVTTPPIEADSTENEDTTLEEDPYICQAILDFPVIKDSASILEELDVSCLSSTKIEKYRKVRIYGSRKKFVIVETDCACCNPFHDFELGIFEENGRYITTITGYKYGFVKVFPNEPSVLYRLDVSTHGNGGHEFFKIDHDTLKSMNTLYDDFPNTVCIGEDRWADRWSYHPNILKMTVSDDNKDGFNDLIFEGVVHLMDENADTYKVRKRVPVKFILLYDKKTKGFKPKRDYHKKYAVIFG